MGKRKKYAILAHIIGWLLFLSLPAVFVTSRVEEHSTGPLFDVVSWISFTVYIVIFYFHTYFLFPQFFLRKEYVIYALCLFTMFCVVFFMRPFDHLIDKGRHPVPNASLVNALTSAGSSPSAYEPVRLPPGSIPTFLGMRINSKVDIVSLVLFILVIAASSTLVIEKRWRLAIVQAADAEIDKATAELSFLRAQINPHFLFNTLNNIYSLAISKNENVADAVMKLSNIMRYVTDEANEEYVPLQNEIDIIKDYIGLQQLRLGKKITLDFALTGDVNEKKIAPLILMTFIENAFKHGISNAEQCEIRIKISVTENQILLFTKNKIFQTERITERSGIGSFNTKKRLQYIYPDKHLLDINTDNNFFTVYLVLNI